MRMDTTGDDTVADDDEEYSKPLLQTSMQPMVMSTVIEEKESTYLNIFSSSPMDAYVRMNALTLKSTHNQGEENMFLESNWDDGEGYYKARIGEAVADKYQTLGVVGKGVFSTVLKCLSLANGDDIPVAVKLKRSNDVMKKADASL
jgi:hypothetical protein